MSKKMADGLEQEYVGIGPDGKEIWTYKHRRIAGAKPGDGKIVHHISGDNKDNSRKNLQVTTMAGHNKIDKKHHLGGRKKGK